MLEIASSSVGWKIRCSHIEKNQKQRSDKPLFMAHNLLSGEHCNEFPPPHNTLLYCLFSAFFWSFAHVPFEYELYS
jgi:hypothetical protein